MGEVPAGGYADPPLQQLDNQCVGGAILLAVKSIAPGRRKDSSGRPKGIICAGDMYLMRGRQVSAARKAGIFCPFDGRHLVDGEDDSLRSEGVM